MQGCAIIFFMISVIMVKLLFMIYNSLFSYFDLKLCFKEKLESATVIVGTCTVVGNGSILDVLEQNHFDIAIVDEAGQATEPAIYPTLVRCPSRLILAGDPHQLPPTVISENKTLSFTLLEKLMKYYPENVVMLKELHAYHIMH